MYTKKAILCPNPQLKLVTFYTTWPFRTITLQFSPNSVKIEANPFVLKVHQLDDKYPFVFILSCIGGSIQIPFHVRTYFLHKYWMNLWDYLLLKAKSSTSPSWFCWVYCWALLELWENLVSRIDLFRGSLVNQSYLNPSLWEARQRNMYCMASYLIYVLLENHEENANMDKGAWRRGL